MILEMRSITAATYACLGQIKVGVNTVSRQTAEKIMLIFSLKTSRHMNKKSSKPHN